MDESAWTAQMRAIESTLYHVTCAMLPDESARRDAMQETALRAWTQQPAAHTDFSTWAVRLTIRVCRDIRRNSAANAPDDADPLANLPTRQRLMIVLTALDGWTLPQTARALGVPTGLAWIWLHQAQKKLCIDDGKEACVP